MFRNGVTTQKFPFKSLTEATTLTAKESGKTFGLATAGGFTVTLPAEEAGLKFTFIVTVAPTTAYIIACDGANDTMAGFVIASTGGDEDYDAAGDTVEFVANTALPGDTVEVFSDGTSWFVKGFCNAAGAITISG